MITVRLTSNDAGKPPQCSTMLKTRALMDDGTALHRRTLMPSNPGAELRGRLVAATSSQEIGDQVPSSSGFGGMRGAASTGTEAYATNGPQCSAICLTSGTTSASGAPSRTSLAARDICERKRRCTRAYSARRRAFLPGLTTVHLGGRERGAPGGKTPLSHGLIASTLRRPSSTSDPMRTRTWEFHPWMASTTGMRARTALAKLP